MLFKVVCYYLLLLLFIYYLLLHKAGNFVMWKILFVGILFEKFSVNQKNSLMLHLYESISNFISLYHDINHT